MKFVDHTQRRTRVGRSTLDEWSARRRDFYLTTLNTRNTPCPRRDSNPQFQQANDRRPTLDLITLKYVVRFRSLSSSLYSFLHSPVTSSLLGPNILLKTLFSNIISLRSSLNVSDHVSHPYKKKGKITFPCILIFMLLDSKLEGKIFCTQW